jgi:dTDP-4-amino-4,6-dideoxygalactose transaminase
MIPLFKVFMSQNAIKRSSEILSGPFIGQGKVVDEFEDKLQKNLNFNYPITVNSGTTALTLALHMLKAKNTDAFADGYSTQEFNWPGCDENTEVLSTPLTCTATNWAILAEGLKIKWVDADPNTLNMSLEDLKNKITEHTKILMLVHWGGYPNDLDKISEILDWAEEKYGFRIAVIEDCAHAFGSKYKNQYIGNSGNFCAFSLQAIKHLTSVDGGILVVPNSIYAKRGRLLRWYGIDRDTPREDFRCEDNIPEFGFKWHMNDVNAGIGVENLEASFLSIRASQLNSRFYDSELKDTLGIINLERNENMQSSCWLHTIRVEDRSNFMKKMESAGIMVSRVHERNDKHSCVAQFKTDLPQLDLVASEMICIPNGFWVDSETRNYIVETIKSGW